MGNSTRMILCYRIGKWVSVKTDELLPGDIVSMKSIGAKDPKDRYNN